MKKSLIVCDDYSRDMYAYCDVNGMRYLSPKVSNKKESPTDLYTMPYSGDSSNLERVDFEFEIVDDFDFYLVDREWFNINTKKTSGDLYWHFQVMDAIPSEYYDGDEDFIDTFKSNCLYSEDECEDSVAIYSIYKRHGDITHQMNKLYALAMCSEKKAAEYGIKADGFID